MKAWNPGAPGKRTALEKFAEGDDQDPLRAKHSPPGVLTRSQEQLGTNHGNSVFRPSLGSWTTIEGSELGGMHEG